MQKCRWIKGKEYFMPLPPFGIALVVYIACGGLLWFTAHLLAPVGYQVSLGRGMGAAVLISVAGMVCPGLMKPFIGGWYLLALVLVQVLIVRGILWLTFWRSVTTVVIYWVVTVAAYYVLFLSPLAKGGRTASMSAAFLSV
jgi:hypothetical protein